MSMWLHVQFRIFFTICALLFTITGLRFPRTREPICLIFSYCDAISFLGFRIRCCVMSQWVSRSQRSGQIEQSVLLHSTDKQCLRKISVHKVALGRRGLIKQHRPARSSANELCPSHIELRPFVSPK